MGKPFKQVWQFIREVTGDDAYERYLAHHRSHHPDRQPPTRRDYFKASQEQKWSKVSRCC